MSDILKNLNKKHLIHFSAIGGIGMSAIAEFLIHNGYKIQGSDISENKNVKRLKEKYRIKVFIGQVAGNVKGADLIVRSTAIKDDNPEIIDAKKLNIPVVHRSDMLAKIMEGKDGISIAGTHGKTSTTAMIAIMLEIAGEDPTVINGGIINYYNDNAKVGEGKHIVVESDESDGTFLKYPAKIKIVTNIEPEHLDFYGTFDKIKEYFYKFVKTTPKNGLAVLCIDDPHVNELYEKVKGTQNITTYGLSGHPDILAKNIKQTKKGLTFDIVFNKENKILKKVFLPMYGIHNVQNILASVAVAKHLNFSDEIIRKALENCTGVQKRFTKVGEIDGITIIDDYGHHPTEIKATMKAGKSILEPNERLIVVFQPHRYTRVRDLFEEFSQTFSDPDVLIVADIYAAKQKPIEGISQDSLIENIKKYRTGETYKLESSDKLAELLHSVAKEGDLVLCSGAGDITYWARNLEEQLRKLRK